MQVCLVTPTFSSSPRGGFWEQDGISAGAWIAYVMGGLLGDQDEDVHLIASEGISLEYDETFSKAEMIVAESAVPFLQTLIV